MSAAAVRREARRLLPPRHLVCVLIGDWARIGKGLSGLGLGPPFRYDPDGAPLP